MFPSKCLPGTILLVGLNMMSCSRSPEPSQPQLSAQALRTSSLRFIQKTNLLGTSGSTTSGSSGGFQASTFPSTGFWPATPLVLPARTAAYINQTYGASGGFQYQSFSFSSSGCNATNAFDRYFGAIEILRGSPLSDSERDSIQSAFSEAFTEDNADVLNQSLCIFYDLMACIADYSVQNEAIFQEAAQSGDFTAIFTGAFSCVAEVLGTDIIDPFDPSDPFPDE